MKKFYLYFSIFCIHAFIAMVAFLHFRLHPGEVLFANYGDGLKNIFTLTTYVKEPITNQGMFKYNTMFYPFGDYVYYTDNVPLFSIPFRWFCHYVYDCSGQTVLIFYICIILNIILSGLLVYYIFRKLVGNNIISYLMALVIPWVNTQILRIQAGHSSFSFSSWILLAIVLVIRIK